MTQPPSHGAAWTAHHQTRRQQGIYLVWQNLRNNMAHMHLLLSQRPLTAMHVNHKTKKVCRVFSGNPNHPRSFEQDHIPEALQYYNSLYNKLHQSKSAEVLHNIIYKPFVPNLTNLKFSYYNHNSGVALVTLLQPPKPSALPKSQTFYSSSLTAKTVMQQGPKQTCSRDKPATRV
jgi:hypothetical protein